MLFLSSPPHLGGPWEELYSKIPFISHSASATLLFREEKNGWIPGLSANDCFSDNVAELPSYSVVAYILGPGDCEK